MQSNSLVRAKSTMSYRELLRAPLSLGLALLAVGAAIFHKGRAGNAAAARPGAGGLAGEPARLEELSRLSRHLLTAGEDEKAHIARDLHDGLGSSLTAVNMDLSWVQQRLADQPALASRLTRAMEVLASTVQMKRRLIHELRPSVLDNLGLSAAIESHAADFSQRNSIPIETDLPEELAPLKNGAPIALFRICEEALNNAVRHAAPTSISISLREDKSSVVMEVSDNGIGIKPGAGAMPATVGLLCMRERAAAIGSILTITPGPGGRGTTVKVVLPRANAAA